MPRRRALCLGLLLVYQTVAAAPPATAPVNGLRESTPAVFALTKARIVLAPGRVLESGTIVLRDGVIEAVGATVTPPADARVRDCSGQTIYPGLIDAFSEVNVQRGRTGSPHWNDLVTPEIQTATQYAPDGAVNKKLRSQGVVLRLVAPAGGIIKGRSALVTTGDEPPHQAIQQAAVAQHFRLTVSSGRGRDAYPNSPMGAVALARQTLYDAQWYRKAWQAARANPSLPRPEHNDALEALQDVVHEDHLTILDAADELFCLRADRFAREFALNAIVRGSGHEYKRLDAIRALGRAILLPVNFPKAPNVAAPEAAMNVGLDALLHWDHAPENPARLDQAGVRIALISHGLSDVEKFLEGVRTAVARGLSPDAALRALTTTPAELFGVANRVGTIETGKAAHLVVTDGDLFQQQTKVLETWVAGRLFEVAPVPATNVLGQWKLTLPAADGSPRTTVIELSGTAAKPKGKVRVPAPAAAADQKDEETPFENVVVSAGQLTGSFAGKLWGRDGVTRLSVVVIVPAAGEPSWLGYVLWGDGTRTEVSAQRQPAETPPTAAAASEPKPAADKAATESTQPTDQKQPTDQPAAADQKEPTDKKEQSDQTDQPKVDPAAAFPVTYPLTAFGRTEPPAQPAAVVFRHARVWTCAADGVLEDVSLLIGQGKILAIGQKIDVPPGTIEIDATGKQIAPGIIDCHSHMATDGGVNESTQAISAEVRIGDFIDADDMNIYRQLAGGVTAANVLHGSANPIGGQNQVIKLRWGETPEVMKFAEAPPGIKFALGENVKQSNWGEQYRTRYPQSRMGVEQIMRDAFLAARQYQDEHLRWSRDPRGLPPRRDLELDAISEILRRERWVHCHSYRQDEILALIRTADEFQFTIGTFQHILEGYKVADEMARHGAMGSAFSDWWAYKFEVFDAIPYAGALMHNAGVVVSFNSDDQELARHLNHEAAKAQKYGGVPAAEALQFVTLNPARQLRIDQYVGSIEVGKHADLVVWSGSPLSTLSRCEQTWIDGRQYFSLDDDRAARARAAEQHTKLVQKILASGASMKSPDETETAESELWPRRDTFCRTHGYDHANQ